MSGRQLGPLWISEFTAGYLEDLLHDELETLKEQLNEHRDNGNGMAWAHVKIQASDIHSLWCDLRYRREELGAPLPEHVESLQDDVKRWSHSMPRSNANSEAWRAKKQLDRERRANLAVARKEARKGVRARVSSSQSEVR